MAVKSSAVPATTIPLPITIGKNTSGLTFATEQNTKDYTEFDTKLFLPLSTAVSYVIIAGGAVVATISVSNKIAQFLYIYNNEQYHQLQAHHQQLPYLLLLHLVLLPLVQYSCHSLHYGSR
jgi:hypothetical protein